MPTYGYRRGVTDPENGLLELREVSFDPSPADLRRVAAFLDHCADRAEAGEFRSSHWYVDAFDQGWGRDHPELDLIVLHHRSTED